MSDEIPGKRALTIDDIKALLKTPERVSVNSPSNKHWLTPEDQIELFKAVDHDADEVYLPTRNQMFQIKYYSNSTRITISPVAGFVPMASITVKKMRDDLRENYVLAAL